MGAEYSRAFIMESLLQIVPPTDENIQFIAKQMASGLFVFIPTDSGYLLCGHYSQSPDQLKSYLRQYPINRKEYDSQVPFIVSMGAHDAIPIILNGEKWNPQENPAHQPLYNILSEFPAPIIVEYKSRRISAPSYKVVQQLVGYLYAPLWAFECIGIHSSDDIQRIYGHIPAYCIKETEADYNETIRGRDATILRVTDEGRVELVRHGAFKIADLPYSIQGILMQDLDEQEKTNRTIRMGLIFKERATLEQFLGNHFGKEDIYMRGIYMDPLARQRDRMELRQKYMGYVTLSNLNSVDDAELHFYEVLWKCMKVRGMACIIVNLGDMPTSGECLLRNMIIRYCDIIM